MLVCYVIHDEQCLRTMRSVVTLQDNREWNDSPAGDTSISRMYLISHINYK